MLGRNGRRGRIGFGGWRLRGREGWGGRPVGRRADHQGGGSGGEGGQGLSEELGVPSWRGDVSGDGEAVRQCLVVVGVAVGVQLLSSP